MGVSQAKPQAKIRVDGLGFLFWGAEDWQTYVQCSLTTLTWHSWPKWRWWNQSGKEANLMTCLFDTHTEFSKEYKPEGYPWYLYLQEKNIHKEKGGPYTSWKHFLECHILYQNWCRLTDSEWSLWKITVEWCHRTNVSSTHSIPRITSDLHPLLVTHTHSFIYSACYSSEVKNWTETDISM